MPRSSRQLDDLARRAGEFKDVHAGIGAVNDIDIAAVVHFDVVGLDGDLTTLVGAGADAALVGLAGNGGNEIGDLLRVKGIANVEGTHAGVEVREEDHFFVVDGGEIFVGGMRAEAS